MKANKEIEDCIRTYLKDIDDNPNFEIRKVQYDFVIENSLWRSKLFIGRREEKADLAYIVFQNNWGSYISNTLITQIYFARKTTLSS